MTDSANFGQKGQAWRWLSGPQLLSAEQLFALAIALLLSLAAELVQLLPTLVSLTRSGIARRRAGRDQPP